MIATTTISSTSVNPRAVPRPARLPRRILRPIQRRPLARAPDVEDVDLVPRAGRRLLLVRADHPVRFPRHRIDRHPPQELDLSLLELSRVEPLDEGVEVGGIA